MRFTLGLILALCLVLPLAATACSPPTQKAELVYDVLPAEGVEPASEAKSVARRVDRVLRGAGFDRFEARPLGAAQLRIVLPETQAGRLDEVRELLAADDLLRGRIRPGGPASTR